MSRLGSAGFSWSPQQLGRSLPLYRPLWTSRGIAAGLTLLAGLLAVSRACDSYDPRLAPLEAAETERLVTARLARVQIAPWAPGPPLPETEAPDWLSAPPPPLWQGRHPRDPDLTGNAAELAVGGRKDLAEGNPQAAATRLLRAVDQQPTWETLFGAGLSLLAAGDPGRALPMLERADRHLDEMEQAGARSPTHIAARIATRQAAGQAALAERNCLQAIHHLRRAVYYLGRYVDAEGALVYDRKLPFRVFEAQVDNHAVWTTLARAYARCEGEYPDRYPARHGEQRYDAEYRAADAPEIEEGPFPAGLAACIAGTPSSLCWAYSNLNKVMWASRSYLPGEGDAAGSRLEGLLLESLARITYDVAWLAAAAEHSEDRRQAGRYLGYAARLDRQARVPGLALRIAELGRHLAPLTGDYSPLAEPWRRRDLSSVTLEADPAPEELKGIAWALSERWLDLLRRRRPGPMIAEVDAQIRRAGPFGESLQEWKRRAQVAMRRALAEEIEVQYSNGNLRAALAIRDFRADWLGAGWARRAARAWTSPRMIAGWLGLGFAWLALTAAVWLIHRLVVFPFLMYLTDGYRLEHQRRHARHQTEGAPFTREELLPATMRLRSRPGR